MIFKGKFSIPLNLAVALMFLGALFKIQHYSYSDLIMNTSLIVFALIYPIWFAAKKDKKALDWAKFCYMELQTITGLFYFNHLPYKSILQYLSIGTLLILAVLWVQYLMGKE